MNTPQNNRIEKILQSLDGTDKAPVPDFFYTRLKAGMEKDLDSKNSTFLLLRPAFLATCLVIVLACNIITLASSKKQHQGQSKAAGNIESFANEYDLGTNLLYE